MDDAAQQPGGRCRTSIHPQEDRQDDVIDLTVKQAMASSNYATYSKQLQVKEWYNNDYPQDDVVRIHERFAHIYFNANVRAAMAQQEDSESDYDYSKEKREVGNCNGLLSICHYYWFTPKL